MIVNFFVVVVDCHHCCGGENCAVRVRVHVRVPSNDFSGVYSKSWKAEQKSKSSTNRNGGGEGEMNNGSFNITTTAAQLHCYATVI